MEVSRDILIFNLKTSVDIGLAKTVDDSQNQDGPRVLPDEEVARRRQEASSRQQWEAVDVEERYEEDRHRNTNKGYRPYSSQGALNRLSSSGFVNQQDESDHAVSQDPRQNFPVPGPLRFSQSYDIPQAQDGRGHDQSRQDRELSNRKAGPSQKNESHGRPTQNFYQEAQRAPERQQMDLWLSTPHVPSLSPADDSEKTISKRAQKAAKVLEAHGQDVELGADNQPKGFVKYERIRNSRVQWRSNDGDDWKLAVYHYQLRPKYVAQQNPFDGFDIPRAKGNDSNDITTFLELWRSWRLSRNDGWRGVQADVLYGFERNRYPIPDYTPGNLIDDGRIVLDLDNHPVKDWEELPLCLSSQLEGSDIETVRRINPAITLLDLRARMPRHTLTGPKKDKITPLFGLTALGNRASRFRERNACPSWVERTGSDRLKSFVWSLMSRDQREANSTEGLGMLTELQVAELKDQAKGKFLERAGSRALPEEERKKRHAADAEKLSRLRQKAGARSEKPSEPRKRECIVLDSDSEEDGHPRGAKRQKTFLEKQPDDELAALSPSRQAVATLDSVLAPYQLNNVPLREQSTDSRTLNTLRASEDNWNDNSSLPMLKHSRHHQSFHPQRDSFSDAAFGGSGYRPPISYDAEPQFPPQSTANKSRNTPSLVGADKVNSDFRDAVSSLPPKYNPSPNRHINPSNYKRRHGEGDSSDEESFEPEPKRREFSNRSNLREDSFVESAFVTSSRPLASRRPIRKIRVAPGAQWPSKALRGTKKHPLELPAINHQHYSNYDDFAPQHASSSRDNGQVHNLFEDQHKEMNFGSNSVVDAPLNNVADNTLDNEQESQAENNTLDPCTWDNDCTSLSKIEGIHSGSQNHGDFQIFEDAPQNQQEAVILDEKIISTANMDQNSYSDKENQTPGPQDEQLDDDPTPGVDIAQSNSILRENTQAMIFTSQRDWELAYMSQFFDFNAASEEGGGSEALGQTSSTELPTLDYRFIDPVNVVDQAHIAAALWYTFAESTWFTLDAKLPTSVWKSYQFQYEEIQAAFADTWKVEGIPTPQLVRLDPWHGSFENWPTPDISVREFRTLYEALPEDAPLWRHPNALEVATESPSD